jgi:tRNA pseudouridine55 synthase
MKDLSSSSPTDSSYYTTLSNIEKHYYQQLQTLFSRVNALQPEKGIQALFRKAKNKAKKSGKPDDLSFYLEQELVAATERTERRLRLSGNLSASCTLSQQTPQEHNTRMTIEFATLAVEKPKGMTSHDVVARLRKIYNTKKIGHLGTLDPLATGILPVCMGKATRLIEYFPNDKQYVAEITLGQTTTTLDAEGAIVSTFDCSEQHLSLERIETVLDSFRGTMQQQVPLYSAVHVKGKKLYEIARKGTEALDFTLPSKEVTFHAITLLSISHNNPAHPVIQIAIHCSSGTYIRSLARDIGEKLGCGAYMSELLRTGHGKFTTGNSISLSALESSSTPEQFLQDPLQFIALPRLVLTAEEDIKKLTQGMKLPYSAFEGSSVDKVKSNQNAIAVTSGGGVLGIIEREGLRIRPVKIFINQT